MNDKELEKKNIPTELEDEAMEAVTGGSATEKETEYEVRVLLKPLQIEGEAEG